MICKEVKSTRRNVVASNGVLCLILKRCDKTLTGTFDNETWFGFIAESSFEESEFFFHQEKSLEWMTLISLNP